MMQNQLVDGVVERMIVLMAAYESNRAMSLEIHDMAKAIQAKTSGISENFAELNRSFSMAKLGIHPCQSMHTRAEPNLNLPQMRSSVNGCQHQIHLQTITKHALSDKLRLAIGSFRAAISQSGKRTGILFSGYTVFRGAAKLSYAPQ